MEWISYNYLKPKYFGRFLVTDGTDFEIMDYFGEYKGNPDWSITYIGGLTLDVTYYCEIPMDNWISIKNKKPENINAILLDKYNKKLFVGNIEWYKDIDDIHITHWMPISPLGK